MSLRRYCARKYRLQKISSKGALLVMFWNLCFHIFKTYIELAVTFTTGALQKVLLSNKPWLFLMYPFIGWFADAWVGRYRVVLAGLILECVALSIGFAAVSVYWCNVSTTIGLALICTGLVTNMMSYGAFDANVVPYMTDQLIGASGEELSALVHWYLWCYYVGGMVTKSVEHLHSHIALLVAIAAKLVCSLICLLSNGWCSHLLDTLPHTTNPIKLIFQVLNYARKNSSPRKRSAFTYIDEEQPSRLDFGKEKFGGPFLEEEIEDVKTVLRFIPLLVVMLGHGTVSSNGFYHHLRGSSLPTNMVSQIENEQNIFFAFSCLIVPVYHFILYPLFYNYIPSLLKRVGTGLFLCMIANAVWMIMDLVGHQLNSNAGCFLQNQFNTTSIHEIPIDSHWIVLPGVLYMAGSILAQFSSFELVIAQTPHGMKGLVIGLWYAFTGLANLIGSLYNVPFHYLANSSMLPSCGFYFFLGKTALSSLYCLLFLVLSKRYKLRQREVTINVQNIIEEHYERYMQQEREHEDDGCDSMNDNNIMHVHIYGHVAENPQTAEQSTAEYR